MSEYHVNELADDSFPTEAALGVLADGLTVDSAAERLADAGISLDRLYFFHGEEAAQMLENEGNAIERFFESDVRQPVIGALRDGKTLVMVYGVDEDDADKVRATMRASCVGETHYFGRWTFS